jgi:hypothetical protein
MEVTVTIQWNMRDVVPTMQPILTERVLLVILPLSVSMLNPGKPGMFFLERHKENTGSNIIEDMQVIYAHFHS